VVTEEFDQDFKNRLSDAPNVTLTSKLVHKARKAFDRRKMAIGGKEPEKDLLIKVVGLKRHEKKDFLEDRMVFSQ
jgi:hypothetical protein